MEGRSSFRASLAIAQAAGNRLGSFSERQGKVMRGWRRCLDSDAGPAAQNHEVRDLPGSKFKVGAPNRQGARSLVLDTL
jgi:hypothetical protein